MSITPSTSERPYTVVGGRRVERVAGAARKTSLIVLHRGGRYRRFELFDDLQRLGFDDVLSLEPSTDTYDIEALAQQYGAVRFLIPQETLSIGTQVNIGMQEALGRVVLVIWNDMELERSAGRVAVRLAEETDHLCVVPLIRSDKGETVPTLSAPAFHGGRFRILPFTPGHDGLPSLFPADYVGLYRRKRFLSIGGYDPAIDTPHWQKLDFGLRAHLWGEHILYHSALRMSSLGRPPADDTTPDESYRRFYLKNLALRFRADQAQLPASRFLPFYVKTGGGMVPSWRLFRSLQQWVFENRYRYVQDARRVTELWEMRE